MKRKAKSFLRRMRRERSGAVAVLVAAGIFAFLGFGALLVDLGYLFYAQAALQEATNAAALAGAQEIGTGGTPCVAATAYSASAGDKNALPIPIASPTVKLECLSGWGIACTTNQSNSSCNAPLATSANIIEASQTANVPTFFGKLLGWPTVPIAARAVASAKGGAVGPFNVAFIIDTTHSMASLSGGTTGTACVGFSAAVDCAAGGIQALLKELWPCVQGTCGTSSPTPFDEVALFVFPPVTNATEAAVDYQCTSAAPDIPQPWPSSPPWAQPGAGGGYSGW